MDADYIIVGGGLAGCVVASRLSQHPSKPTVILIEAGSDPSKNPNTATFLAGMSLLGSDLDYAYQSEPQPTTHNRIHTLNAGKTLGGGSILNFGGWLRADAGDYDQWAKTVGDERWSYKGFLPWFRKTESFFDLSASKDQHGFDGPMHVTSISCSNPRRKYPLREPVRKAWAELGVSYNPGRPDGSIEGLVEFHENSRDGQRQPSHKAYGLEQVQLLTNTPVHRVIFSGKKATGVQLVDGRQLTAHKEVILSGGTYRTPQLLMLSGIGPLNTLAEHGIDIVHPSPHVGSNLFDHFAVYLAFRVRDRESNIALGSPGWTDPALFSGLPFDWCINEKVPSDLVASHTPSNGSDSFATSLRSLPRPLYETFTAYVPPGIPGIPVDGSHVATSTMLLLPTSRGNVSLKSSSPTDPPKVDPKYFSTELDQVVLIRAIRRTLTAMLGTEALKPFIHSETPPSGEGLDGLEPLTLDTDDKGIEERIRCTGMQHHHSAGTAAMGSVVDTEGKVIGVEGLRVIDASVIPVPFGGHPQATLYAMAEQLASMILPA